MTTTLTLKTPEDIITLVPHLIGFHPTESLVVVVPKGRPSCARIDMPTWPQQQVDAVDALYPLWRQGLPVLVVTYTLDDEAADSTVDRLRQSVEVLTHIRVHAETYRADDGPETPLVDSGRIEATMIYRGSAPASSRADLALPTKISESLARTLSTGKFDDHTQADEETWVLGRLTSHARFTDAELARIITGCSRFGTRFRDVIGTTFDRSIKQKEQWRDAAERVGDGWTEVLVTYAMAAWLAGDGAQAWVGIEAVVASSSDRDDTLALLIGQSLQAGIDPASFEIGTLGEVNEVES
jgi:hypothetical protein